VGQEKMGLQDPGLVQAVAALGGGIASSGKVCGILTGGVVFLSSLYGKTSPEGRDHPHLWRLTYRLSKKFEERTKAFGGPDCRDIARVNWKDRDAVRSFYTNPEGRRNICLKLVGETARDLGEILEEAERA
jgi:C_GCAxxG_C_C family probable redox protein